MPGRMDSSFPDMALLCRMSHVLLTCLHKQAWQDRLSLNWQCVVALVKGSVLSFVPVVKIIPYIFIFLVFWQINHQNVLSPLRALVENLGQPVRMESERWSVLTATITLFCFNGGAVWGGGGGNHQIIMTILKKIKMLPWLAHKKLYIGRLWGDFNLSTFAT